MTAFGEEIGVDMIAQPLSRLRFVGLSEYFRARMQGEISFLAYELERLLRDEFSPHDRGPIEGGDPDRTVRTIDTFHVEILGMTAQVTMGGAASFIEYGTSAHWIEPTNPYGALHWSEGDQEFFSKGHEVSGVTPDPFVERAIDRVDLGNSLGRIFKNVHFAQWGEPEA